MNIESIEETYLTDVINGLLGQEARRRGECAGNLSFWNPGEEYKTYMSERITVPMEQELYDYVYSYTMDVTKPFLARLGAGDQNDVERTFTTSSTISIAHAVNLMRLGGLRRLCILTPSYFSVEKCCRAFGLEHEAIPLIRDSAGWRVPVKRILEGGFDALWVTSPIYGTGEEFSDEMLDDIRRLRDEHGLFVVFDESLALPGQELVRRVDIDDASVFIYSPHKAISVNTRKFSAIVYHTQYLDAIEDWTEVLGGSLPRSCVGAIYHYLSDNYHDVCVPAYRDFVLRREADLASVLAKFPWAYVMPNGSGHYRTVFMNMSSPDDGRVVELIDRVHEKTGYLFYPGTITGFPREFGLSFRVNLLLDRANIIDGLGSVLSVLEDIR